MRHRGPDASGEWSSSDRRLHLAHQRLSIIDLSSAGNQPMVDQESGCVVVFNGEIYNFRELRLQLKQRGFSFHSRSDTEVLLKGYLHWGEDLLTRLRGMFAFALWDPRKQALWLVRDPYGIKPLYYSDDSGCFAFASQVKPLREYVETDTRADPAGLVGFLLLGTVPEPYTCYRGIRALPAGHTFWVSNNGATPARPYALISQIWHDAAQMPELLDEASVNEKVRSAVKASVRAHMVSDVPVGAFLSAGVDSGAIVGLMSETGAELRTVTLGFKSFSGTGQDETGYAEQLAAYYQTRQHTVWVRDDEAEADFPQILQDMDQPSIDGINTWLVSKHTAALGLKVVVSGVGGDELFGGYDHFKQIPLWRTRLKRLSAIPGLLPLLSSGTRFAGDFGLVHRKAEGLARFGHDLAGQYLVRRGLFMPRELPHLLDGDLLKEGLEALSPPVFIKESVGDLPPNDFASVAAMEACFYLRNQLLRDSDWASMAHSLELRTPLVDFQLLKELAPVLLGRPASLRGKRPLAMAPRPILPDEVMHRPKSGFSLPMDRWVQQSDILSSWRQNEYLTRKNVPWARRMAYSLLASNNPEAVAK